MEYGLLDLITMLEDAIRKAAPFPFGKKSLVDVGEIDNIATEMRLVLPKEIQQAQNIIADKNRIIADAKKEAEDIIRKAEQQRKALIEENSILQEARRRATEEISSAQQRSTLIRNSTQDIIEKKLAGIEELLAKDINDLRVLRRAFADNAGAARPVPLPEGKKKTEE